MVQMIKSFRHKGLEHFFREGSKAGIQPAHAGKLRLQLAALDQSVKTGRYVSSGMGAAPAQRGIKGTLGSHREW